MMTPASEEGSPFPASSQHDAERGRVNHPLDQPSLPDLSDHVTQASPMMLHDDTLSNITPSINNTMSNDDRERMTSSERDTDEVTEIDLLRSSVNLARDDINNNSNRDEDISHNDFDPSSASKPIQFDYKTKLKQTLVYCIIGFTLGIVVNVVGPTMIILMQSINENAEKSAGIFTARGAGWLIGSLVGGKITEFGRGHVALAIIAVTCAALMFLIPFVPSLWMIYTIHVVMSTAMGIAEVLNNTLIYFVWNKQLERYMHALHFAFAFGATIAPGIVGFVYLIADTIEMQLRISYCGMSVIVLVGAVGIFIPSPHPKVDTSGDTKEEKDPPLPVSKLRYWTIVSVVATFLFIYVGAEVAFGGWIFAYATEVYLVREAAAAYMTSAFWAAITLGRALAIYLSRKVSGTQLLTGNLIGCIVTMTLLLIFNQYRSEFLLWSIAFGFGLSMSNIFGSLFALPTVLGLPISGRAASIFVVGGSAGDMAIPAVVGIIYYSQGAATLPISLLGMSFLLVFLFIAFLLLCQSIPNAAAKSTAGSKPYTSLHDNPEEGIEMRELEDK